MSQMHVGKKIWTYSAESQIELGRSAAFRSSGLAFVPVAAQKRSPVEPPAPASHQHKKRRIDLVPYTVVDARTMRGLDGKGREFVSIRDDGLRYGSAKHRAQVLFGARPCGRLSWPGHVVAGQRTLAFQCYSKPPFISVWRFGTIFETQDGGSLTS
jgi:hypothetical protein